MDNEITKETTSPMSASVERLRELTKHWDKPLQEGAGEMEILIARRRAAAEWMCLKAQERARKKRITWEAARKAYEEGTPIRQLSIKYHLKEKRIEQRIIKEKWGTPKESIVMSPTGEDMSRVVSLVTPENEENLPSSTRQLIEERRLMNLAGDQWDMVPFEKQQEALRMQVHRLARRAVERMNQMDMDELVDPQVMKTIRDVVTVMEKVAPPPSDQMPKANGSLLHMVVMNGEAVLPPKAKTIEIAN